MKKYAQFIKESDEFVDPLSGTTDIKFYVQGDDNNILTQKLIDELSLVVKKRKSKSLRIKNITGYVNKETFSRVGYFYDTSLEVILTNRDIINGNYNSAINNINIKINDNVVYDLDHGSFDNEVLIDKMIKEYFKYLKNSKYKINENAYEIYKDLMDDDNKYDDAFFIGGTGDVSLYVNLKYLIKLLDKDNRDPLLFLIKLIRGHIVNFYPDDSNDEKSRIEIKAYDVTYNGYLVVNIWDDAGHYNTVNLNHNIIIRDPYLGYKNNIKKEPRIRWYNDGKLDESLEDWGVDNTNELIGKTAILVDNKNAFYWGRKFTNTAENIGWNFTIHSVKTLKNGTILITPESHVADGFYYNLDNFEPLLGQPFFGKKRNDEKEPRIRWYNNGKLE